ncbi:MAG: hypothetical protein RIR12_635 [Bacteroidota bacterium]
MLAGKGGVQYFEVMHLHNIHRFYKCSSLKWQYQSKPFIVRKNHVK